MFVGSDTDSLHFSNETTGFRPNLNNGQTASTCLESGHFATIFKTGIKILVIILIICIGLHNELEENVQNQIASVLRAV